MASGERGIFTPEDAKSEVSRQKRPSRTLEWRINSTQCIELTIPPTVYPPRELEKEGNSLRLVVAQVL